MRSPSGNIVPGTGSVDLPTGRLSPVSAASSISRVAATQIRPSAGTRLPASTSTTSPGTSSSASISIAWPSRRTRAIVFIIWASALTLSSALASWRSPMTALNTVSPASTTEVPTSPVTTRLISAAASRMICMKSRYWRRNACTPDSRLAPANRLRPCDPSRRAASSTLNPHPRINPQLPGNHRHLRPIPTRTGSRLRLGLMTHRHDLPSMTPTSAHRRMSDVLIPPWISPG